MSLRSCGRTRSKEIRVRTKGQIQRLLAAAFLAAASTSLAQPASTMPHFFVFSNGVPCGVSPPAHDFITQMAYPQINPSWTGTQAADAVIDYIYHHAVARAPFLTPTDRSRSTPPVRTTRPCRPPSPEIPRHQSASRITALPPVRGRLQTSRARTPLSSRPLVESERSVLPSLTTEYPTRHDAKNRNRPAEGLLRGRCLNCVP